MSSEGEYEDDGQLDPLSSLIAPDPEVVRSITRSGPPVHSGPPGPVHGPPKGLPVKHHGPPMQSAPVHGPPMHSGPPKGLPVKHHGPPIHSGGHGPPKGLPIHGHGPPMHSGPPMLPKAQIPSRDPSGTGAKFLPGKPPATNIYTSESFANSLTSVVKEMEGLRESNTEVTMSLVSELQGIREELKEMNGNLKGIMEAVRVPNE